MVNLIPSAESVMKILQETAAYRFGHFVNQAGEHSSHYFKVPRAFHFYDNARVLSVGLSRKFRMEKTVASFLPQIAIVSPTPDSIPVAFSMRDALNAEQIYWATRESGTRRFPNYVDEHCKFNPCIIVDDIVRSGSTMRETFELVKKLGVKVIGCGAIVRFKDGPTEIDGIKIESLVEFDSPIYDTSEKWQAAEGNDAPQILVSEF